MRVGERLQLRAGEGPGGDADDQAAAGIGPFFEIDRGIADFANAARTARVLVVKSNPLTVIVPEFDPPRASKFAPFQIGQYPHLPLALPKRNGPKRQGFNLSCHFRVPSDCFTLGRCDGFGNKLDSREYPERIFEQASPRLRRIIVS